MNCQTFKESLKTCGRNDVRDITDTVQETVRRAKVNEGQATIFVPGSTAGVTTVEYESGVVQDLASALERLFPENLRYAHHETAGDDNGFSHIRAAFIGPSLTVPVTGGQLTLGTWQQIVFVDFDSGPRSRTYHIQIMGQ